MDRRKALISLGALLGALIGTNQKEAKSEATLVDVYTKPLDYYFSEAGCRNLIIERDSGETVTIPFKEIFDAVCNR